MKSLKLKLTALVVTLTAVFGLCAGVPALGHPVFADAKSEATKGVSDTGAAHGSVPGLVKSILVIITYIVGVASVIMILVGGIKYITSQGDSGAISSAKNTIMYAIVGLVIAIFAQAIVRFVLGKI